MAKRATIVDDDGRTTDDGRTDDGRRTTDKSLSHKLTQSELKRKKIKI